MLFGGTSLVTTLPAPTIAFSPIVTLARMVQPEPIEAPFFTTRALDFPVGFGLQFAVAGGGARIGVVDERHAVADEDVVLDGHAFADEGVAGNLAALADGGILLDFDECADLGFVADLAAVKIDELRELNVFPQLHAGRDAEIVSMLVLLIRDICGTPTGTPENYAAPAACRGSGRFCR